MNRFLLLIICALFAVPVSAQFTVTQNNFPRSASFTDTILSSDLPGIALPAEGGGLVWDYSDITTTNTAFSVHTDATADPVFTEALNSFDVNMSFLGQNVPARMFEAIDSSGFHNDGMSISEIIYPLGLFTSDPSDSVRILQRDDVYQGRINPVRFPCAYQIQWSGTHVEQLDFALTLASANLNEAQGFRRTILTDSRDVLGYGKLLIPDFNGGTTDTMDVLQIKVFQQTVDSFFLMGSPAPDSVLTDIGLTQGAVRMDTFYVFYRADYSGTVLELDIENGAVSKATYRPQADNVVNTGIAEELVTLDMKFYPNPIASGQQLNIVMPTNTLGNYKVTMLDLMGRQLTVATLEHEHTYLDIPAGTPTGMYLVFVTSNEGIVSRMKLQVQ